MVVFFIFMIFFCSMTQQRVVTFKKSINQVIVDDIFFLFWDKQEIYTLEDIVALQVTSTFIKDKDEYLGKIEDGEDVSQINDHRAEHAPPEEKTESAEDEKESEVVREINVYFRKQNANG